MATIMLDKLLDEGTVTFQTEGRLLQELGERLVASPEVALVELIKNAYDADSASCEVRVADNGKALVISDSGHGMTFTEFVERWMRIASPGKIQDRVSRVYERRLTGAKGIGRFAVRYLGDHLTLITVAVDSTKHMKTKLTAHFDWPVIDKFNDLGKANVDYTLEEMPKASSTGTTLEVRKLKSSADFSSRSSLRSDVLRIVTPLQGLDPGKFKRIYEGSKTDPGFQVTLPESEAGGVAEINLADIVLKNYWARLQVELTGNDLVYRVWFSSSREPKTLQLKVQSSISAGFVADVRYFPRRKGVFRGKDIDGRVAWRWVRDNYGVVVVDHGFRVVPFGNEDDDWLHLSIDKAHSERDWRSSIAKKKFPIPPAVRKSPSQNPALYLPYDYQLVGAVFVESKPPKANKQEMDLIPSMDREGFLKNSAFDELVEYVRAGIEFLALHDKRELDRLLAKEAREAAESARQDVRRAIDYVKQSPTLTASDKARITKVYRQLSDRIEQVEEYNVQARRSLMTMSLLGVVAAFMTHENKSLVFEMEKATKVVSSLAKKHEELREVADDLNQHLSAFKGQLQYVQMFLEGVRRGKDVKMSAAGQIRHVLNRFESFAADHGVKVTSETSAQVQTPPLSPAVYSGVLLNLYTNALKAVLSVAASIRHPTIAVRSWNDKTKHYLEVSDNGIGVPPDLRTRIWDPLYTTTSDTGNPLGSGMGLGLTLVKQVVEDAGGRVSIVDDPPPGFTTCFRVVFPLE
jgi:signal transduction histidine kinase